ncbi:ComEA family DNA-binding protein [Nocardioides yefusunii]|uniref:ComEA family DNA-binding protein n=1 Tax=Nocardioides yefusunii TaxID=2500546 RepID=A0ABW1QUN7_9ACTN|nr:helix-hairpin-helix domain-containing protein [Nocardioides yefusunii]
MSNVPARNDDGSRPGQAWLWAVPLFSVGLLGFVPPLAIALRARTSLAWGWFAGFVAALVLGLTFVDSEGFLGSVAVAGILASMGGAAVYSAVRGKQYFFRPAPAPRMGSTSIAGDANQLALAQVAAQRRRREDARTIVRNDPGTARDLGIGRPDLGRGYDDGGLVDLNSAPVELLVAVLGLTPTQGQALVEARARVGRFTLVEDLHLVSEIDLATYDRITDRVVLL